MSREAPPEIPAGRIAVFDLEWTSWEGAQARNWSGPGEDQEIVEIGAVLLDGRETLREVGCFEALVRPRINPRLSDYFVRLTGIDQQMVDRDGVPFADALAAFGDFLGFGGGGNGKAAVAAVLSFGRDPEVLRHNCGLNGVRLPWPDRCFRNVRPVLAAFAGRPVDAVSSSDLPALLGFPAPAGAHRALGDARCIAEALRRWRRAA